MFTLVLHYPNDHVHNGAVKEVRSSYVPPIGFEIYSDRSAALRVTNVLAGIKDGVLDGEINVMLASTED